jgi:diacylglycerol kinase (CTP)
MRKSELKNLTSATYLLIGVYIIVLFFPAEIVHLALFFLAFGDPIASTFGILYGKDRLIGKKSLQGSMACFITCAVISYVYFWQGNLMTERLFLASALSGLIGALAELVPVGKIDDNLSIPVFSSLLLWGLFHLFGAM